MKTPSPEFLRVASICDLFDCDRGTLDKILTQARQTHDIPVLVWNGQKRISLPAFRKYLIEHATLSF